ncbi:MAG: hypothetical protein ACM3SU_16730 [Acidobacteriota bacterium]
MGAILSGILLPHSWAASSVLALLVLVVGTLLSRHRELPQDTPLFPPP